MTVDSLANGLADRRPQQRQRQPDQQDLRHAAGLALRSRQRAPGVSFWRLCVVATVCWAATAAGGGGLLWSVTCSAALQGSQIKMRG